MTKADARTIIRGLFHDGMQPRDLTPPARQELRDAVDAVLRAITPDA